MADVKYDVIVPDLPEQGVSRQTYWPALQELILRYGGEMTSTFTTLYTPATMINGLSRRKGVVIDNDMDSVDDNQLMAIKYGLEMATTTGQTPLDLFNKVMAAPFYGLGYYYNRPPERNVNNTPYRVSDWCGYYPNAVAQYSVLLPSRIAYNGQDDSALVAERFPIETRDFRTAVGDHDGISGYNYCIDFVSTGLHPASSAGVGYRAGVFMYADYGNIIGVAFGGFSLMNPSHLDANKTSIMRICAGKEVKMMPFLSNMPYDRFPDDVVRLGINNSEWSDVTNYALCEGVVTVNFDEEEVQAQSFYDKARIIEFFGQYHDTNKDSVFCKIWLASWENKETIENLIIGIHNEYGERLEMKAFGNVNFGASGVEKFMHVFRGLDSYEFCHLEVWWDSKLQRRLDIREAI